MPFERKEGRMRIDVIGWYGEHNCGDEAFRLVLNDQLQNHVVNFCKFYSGGDVALFGGGGVVQGSYLDNLPARVPKFAIGVDLSLHDERFERWRRIEFKHMWVRSRSDLAVLSNMMVMSNVSYCPDIAFMLGKPREPLNRSNTGIILSSDLTEPQRTQMIQAISRIDGPLSFVSFYNGDGVSDAEMNNSVINELPLASKRGMEVVNAPNPHYILNYIAGLKQVFTMRFHASVFATLARTPFTCLGNLGKMSHFADQEQIPSGFINLNDRDAFDLIPQIANSSSRAQEGYFLSGISYKNIHILNSVFNDLRGMLDKLNA